MISNNNNNQLCRAGTILGQIFSFYNLYFCLIIYPISLACEFNGFREFKNHGRKLQGRRVTSNLFPLASDVKRLEERGESSKVRRSDLEIQRFWLVVALLLPRRIHVIFVGRDPTQPRTRPVYKRRPVSRSQRFFRRCFSRTICFQGEEFKFFLSRENKRSSILFVRWRFKKR